MSLSRIGHIRRIAHKGVLGIYRRCLLLVLKMSRSTLPNVNLTLCAYYTSSRSMTLRLVPSHGCSERVEQQTLKLRLSKQL